jgi:hypothetical protein
MSLLKQAIIAAARYSNQAEEENKQKLRLEHVLGLGTGLSVMSPLIGQKPMMDLGKVKRMGAHDLFMESRPGDVVLTHNKAPYSAWRAVTPILSGAPYYHAEILGNEGMSHMAGGADPLYTLLKNQRGGVLLRPKKLTATQQKGIARNAIELAKEEYSPNKLLATAAGRIFLPPSVPLPNCKGNVCSTGPADVMRRSGVDPGLKAPKGYELASDYLRSDKYEPVGYYGTKFNLPKWDRLYNPLIRLAMGSALGGSVYKGVKDIREGEGMAPLAALLGAAGGMYGGWKLEQAAGERNPAKYIAKHWPGWQATMGSRQKLVNKWLKKIPAKASLTPSVAGLVGGGLGAYGLAKGIYWLRRKREEQRDRNAKIRAARSYLLAQ